MKRVLIIVDTSRSAGRQLLSGAERYTSAFAGWEVHTKSPQYLRGSGEKDDYRLDDFDGYFICDAENISRIIKIKKPKVVNSIHKEKNPGASSIITNSDKIGKMAAEYFFSRGFRNFAYCGFGKLSWSQRRYRSYKKSVARYGGKAVFEFHGTGQNSGKTERQLIAKWLQRLPKPLCVFACNDDRAIYVLEACKKAGINVPEQVAVLGVDNDRLVCNLSSPPLSSILLEFENAGFEGARHLDELMNEKAANKVINVDPTEIIERQSTDILAVDDEEVVSAMVFMRNNFHKPIQADDVVEATTLSRRALEYRFRHQLNRTIKQELDRLRIKHIKKLLASTTDPLYIIAGTLEFTDTEHFSRYFKNLTGMGPLEFRRLYGGKSFSG